MFNNSMMIINPYKEQGTWMFDDDATGLVKEPFVAGIPEIIEGLLKEINIENGEEGFKLIFSSNPFPGFQLMLVKDEYNHSFTDGTWYKCEETLAPSISDMRGWLCPALFKYFKTAPDEIYIKAENLIN